MKIGHSDKIGYTIPHGCGPRARDLQSLRNQGISLHVAVGRGPEIEIPWFLDHVHREHANNHGPGGGQNSVRKDKDVC